MFSTFLKETTDHSQALNYNIPSVPKRTTAFGVRI